MRRGFLNFKLCSFFIQDDLVDLMSYFKLSTASIQNNIIIEFDADPNKT